MDNQIKIPTNLSECFDELDIIFGAASENDQEWVKTSNEEDFMADTHHSLGQWIRNEWGLWSKNTALYMLLNEMGLWHADDMSSIILTSYHRKKNNKELQLENQVRESLKFWKDYEKENGPIEK